MKEETKSVWIASIMIILVIIVILLINMFINYKFPYSCDTGKPEIAGDYQIHGWAGLGGYPYRYCAVQDCVAYNKLNNDTKCVV